MIRRRPPIIDTELTIARKAARDHFNSLWMGHGARMTGKEAHAWLRKALGVEAVNFSAMDVATCAKVMTLCDEWFTGVRR